MNHSPNMRTVAVWTLPIVMSVAAVSAVNWYGKSSKNVAAHDPMVELLHVTQEAQLWIVQGQTTDGDSIERRLSAALAKVDDNDRALSNAVLIELRRRLADAIFRDAQRHLESRDFNGAQARLERYLTDTNGTQRPAAQELLAQLQAFGSEDATIESLSSLSDEQIARIEHSGSTGDIVALHPALSELRIATQRKALQEVARRRREQRASELDSDVQEMYADGDPDQASQANVPQEDASAPLEVLLGGFVSGNDASWLRGDPGFMEIKKEPRESAFDTAPDWDTSFEATNMALAPGVFMRLTIKNLSMNNDPVTQWSWFVTLLNPNGGIPEPTCAVDFVIDGQVESFVFFDLFQVPGRVHVYEFRSFDTQQPVEPIIRNLARIRGIQYRLRYATRTHEGILSRESQNALDELLDHAEHEDEAAWRQRLGI